MTATAGLDPGDHLVHFFSTEADFLSVASDHVAQGLENGGAVVLVARPRHQQSLLQALWTRGVDVDALTTAGRVVAADATETLARFMVGDVPDAGAFDAVISGLLAHVDPGARTVRILGEMVAALWETGNCLGALEVERLWNTLQMRLPFHLLCSYPVQAQDLDGATVILAEVCRIHDVAVGIAPSDAGAERTQRFPRALVSSRAARAFVRDTLVDWGCGAIGPAAELVVSELGANAMMHGRSDFTVSLTRTGGGVRIAVGDISGGTPVLLQTDPEAATGGRGLGLVDSCAQQWGYTACPIGKLVWAHVVAA
jgi:MEDS: MEthanogen/methylotroph, DcmR Sensory domain